MGKAFSEVGQVRYVLIFLLAYLLLDRYCSNEMNELDVAIIEDYTK